MKENKIVLAASVQARRRKVGLTQLQLAYEAKCSLSLIQKIEHGERMPSLQVLTSLVQALELTEPEATQWRRLVLAREGAGRVDAGPERQRPFLDASLAQLKLATETRQVSAEHGSSPAPLIGRVDEMRALALADRDESVRILTIVGGPGVGKSALASAYSAQLHHEARPVCIVRLAGIAPIPEPAMASMAVASAIARVVGFSPEKERPVEHSLFEFLEPRSGLLVLDNMEHLLGARDMLVRLISRAPNMRLLVTSRSRLRLRSERVFTLRGMSLATHHGALSPAAELFVHHRGRVSGRRVVGRKLAADDLRQITRICEWVNGLPLAIELAAGLTHTRELSEIADSIAQDFDVLETDESDVPPAQQSMRAAYHGSWRLLTARQQSVLVQLAALDSDFSLEEARALVGSPTGRELIALVEALDALTEASLLRRAPDGRYTMDRMLRAYARSTAL